MKRQVDYTKMLAVFLSTTFIFMIGLFIGSWTSNAKLGAIENIEESLRVDALSLDLQYSILAEDPCRAINASALSDELYEVGSKLGYMENSLGQKNQRVLSLKEFYSLLELRHWLFLKNAQEQCGNQKSLILYFYSNLNDCPRCQEQGFVLDYLRKKDSNLNIYSLDINIDNLVLDSIKQLYGIEEVPALLIGEELYTGFKDSKQVEALI